MLGAVALFGEQPALPPSDSERERLLRQLKALRASSSSSTTATATTTTTTTTTTSNATPVAAGVVRSLVTNVRFVLLSTVFGVATGVFYALGTGVSSRFRRVYGRAFILGAPVLTRFCVRFGVNETTAGALGFVMLAGAMWRVVRGTRRF